VLARKWDIGIGIFGILLAALLLLVWIPADIKGEFISQTSGGRAAPGDAFYPTLLAAFITVVAVIQLVLGLRRRSGDATDTPRITLSNLVYLLLLAGILLVAYLLCYIAGPALAELLSPGATYRELIDTVPYKYFGFFLGGFVLTAGVIAFTEREIRWRTVVVSALLLALLILVFDVALTNIQIPPNAEA